MINFYFLPVCSYAMWPMDDSDGGDDEEAFNTMMSDPDIAYMFNYMKNFISSKIPNMNPLMLLQNPMILMQISEELNEDMSNNPDLKPVIESIRNDPAKKQAFAMLPSMLLRSMMGNMMGSNQQVVINTTHVEYKSKPQVQTIEITTSQLFKKIIQDIYELNIDCKSITKSILEICIIKIKNKIDILSNKNSQFKQQIKQNSTYQDFLTSIKNFDEKTISSIAALVKEFPSVAEDITPIIKELQETVNNNFKNIENQKTFAKKKLIVKNFLSNYDANSTIMKIFDPIKDVSDLFMQFNKIKLVTDDLAKSFNLVETAQPKTPANKKTTPNKK